MNAADDKTLSLDDIGERYGGMRLCNPKAQHGMLQSLQKYGQVSPVVVCPGLGGGYELIDGFKRLRASRQISTMESLTARVLTLGDRACKAAMLCLNWASRGVSDLEEAWVVHSLCRDDCLSQVEVAELVGKGKSWVCRRLALAERLTDEVQSQLKLGLVTATVGRELARLPRGNQQRVLEVVNQHRLGSREVAGLVDVLLSSGREQHAEILRAPLVALSKNGKWRRPHHDDRLSAAGNRILRQMNSIQMTCSSVSAATGIEVVSKLSRAELSIVARPVGGARRAAELAMQVLDDILAAAGEQRHGPIQQP